MRIEGVIRPTDGGARFGRDVWCQLVSRRPEILPVPYAQIRNPFTGKVTGVDPAEDAAEVVLGGSPVGNARWSMSGEPLVCVSVEQAAMPLVLEWAKELERRIPQGVVGHIRTRRQTQPWRHIALTDLVQVRVRLKPDLHGLTTGICHRARASFREPPGQHCEPLAAMIRTQHPPFSDTRRFPLNAQNNRRWPRRLAPASAWESTRPR